ncbi:MAG: hypothetical protein H0W64_03290 [Gammaproteobacteria bacterium]|nr:hypothetical protein [Gammaproteobacteria bacterium]
MSKSVYRKLRDKLDAWLSDEPPPTNIMPYDFNRLKFEIRPGDVLIIEGRSRVSKIIRTITQSPWTHAALYIGRLIDIEDESLQQMIRSHADVKDNTRLIIEDLLDHGTVITPLNFYHHHHIRICRPIGITPSDLHLVMSYAIKALGQPYNVRHLLDLARFLLPWSILPRRWGSTLFRTSQGEAESGICSSLIAEAFSSVQFPILPYVKQNDELEVEMYNRNPYLYTPKDFDYSPYFEIIKYPLFNPEEPLPYYRRLPWSKSGLIHHDHGVLLAPHHNRARKIVTETVKNPSTSKNKEQEKKAVLEKLPPSDDGKE